MSVTPVNDGRNSTGGVEPVNAAMTDASDDQIFAAMTEQGAWEVGRKLAADPLVTRPDSDSNEAVINALYRCRSIVMRWGIRIEIVRTRRGCAVVRVAANSNESYLIAKSAFEAIPANLGLGSGVVVEAAHSAGESTGRLCTLLWTLPQSPQAPDNNVVLAQGVSISGVSPYDAGEVEADDVPALPSGSLESTVPFLPAPPFFETLAAQASVDSLPLGDDDHPSHGAETDVFDASVFDPPLPPPPPPPPAAIVNHPQSTGSVPGDVRSTPGSPIPEPPNCFVSTGRTKRQEPPLTNGRYPSADIAPAPQLPLGKATRRPTWLWRRGWILVLTVLAGMFGAQLVALGHAPTYTARATLLVQSGAGASGPGAANDAAALAITYAAVIPTDGATIKAAARVLDVPQSQVAANISMSAESGTSVIVLNYTAPTAAEAIKAADVVAQIVAKSPSGSAIPSRSISVVREPVSASLTSSLRRYALVLGGIVGLAVGLIVVMALERSDPHLDDATVVSEVFACPSNALPGEIGLPELARAIALVADSSHQLTVLPLERSDQASAANLAAGLRQVWPPDMAIPSMTVSTEFESAAVSLSQGTGPTVVVLGPGVSKRRASTVAERLRLIKRDPLWAVVMGRIQSSTHVY